MAHNKEPHFSETSAEKERNPICTPVPFDEYLRNSEYPNITQGYRRTSYGGVKKCEPGDPSGRNWDFIEDW